MLGALLASLPIRLRLTVGYTLLLVATVVGVGVYLLASLEGALQEDTDAELRLRAGHLERELAAAADGLDPRAAALALASLAPVEEFAAPGIYAQVRDAAGAVVAASPNLPPGALPAEPAALAGALAGREVIATVPAGRERVRVLARPLRTGSGVSQEVVGVILVGESLHSREATLGRTRQLLVVATLGAALVSLVGGWWLTRRALEPVAEVTQVARRIAETGEFDRRLAAPPAQDELRELVATFNDMLGRLERTIRRQREFLADASHELRGPLMVIRGNLDLLRLGLPEPERLESAREASEEVERMSRLVSDLLFLAEVDAQEQLECHLVRLDELVAETAERARALDAGRHAVAVERADPTVVLGDPDRLRQLLWNLVENALRYTPAGGRVTLSLRGHGPVAELSVADTGVGIAPEHLPRLFERFYRADRSRSRAAGGTGLGLAIVRQVAEAHGGQVRVRSEPGEGTTFTVALPAALTPGPSPDAGEG